MVSYGISHYLILRGDHNHWPATESLASTALRLEAWNCREHKIQIHVLREIQRNTMKPMETLFSCYRRCWTWGHYHTNTSWDQGGSGLVTMDVSEIAGGRQKKMAIALGKWWKSPSLHWEPNLLSKTNSQCSTKLVCSESLGTGPIIGYNVRPPATIAKLVHS